MNTYAKLTVDTFNHRLKEGGYKSLAGARRALGKAEDLSEADKQKCRGAADRHFGVVPVNGTAKPAPKKAATKKEAKPAAAAPKRKAQTRASSPTPARRATSGSSAPTTADDIRQNPTLAIGLAEKAIGVVASAVAVMGQAKQVYPNINLNETQSAVDALKPILDFAFSTVLPPVLGRTTHERQESTRAESNHVAEEESASATS
jgi:hypothetical protein